MPTLGWIGLGLLGWFGVVVLIGKIAGFNGHDDCDDAPAICTPPRTAPGAAAKR